ncbi:MAG TPA: RtcB family protein [Terriglobia bacterium]|nr:RtcB family protein [Terriglobia bacterium]
MHLEKIDDYRWMIPRTYKPGMLTDTVIFDSEQLLEAIRRDQSLEQAANIAMLPGIAGRALAMPDIHQGYGFPIGGVAAMDEQHGVVSPGGVGFDINCGVRLLSSNLTMKDVRPKLRELVHQLFRDIPSGTGQSSRLKLSPTDLNQVLEKGPKWAIEHDMGSEADLDHTEERGCIAGADAYAVSDRAKQRGGPQLGTLGSGNHFVEVQRVDEIFDEKTASQYNLHIDGIVLLIHTGSRGLGHQVCTDYVSQLDLAMRRYDLHVPDRQLACAPIHSPEGQRYLHAMAAAANFAWTNRQCIAHAARGAFKRVLGDGVRMPVIYDVAHNIAKVETHMIDGRPRRVVVHRKGATRAFPNQPVFIPGSMGTASYFLLGQEGALRETFGSACHGAGRLLSRSAAKKGVTAKEIQKELESRGIIVESLTREGLTEEKPEAYKDIESVVDVVHNAGLAARVARLRPVGVIKG